MTFTKEQISQAFIQVLNERVPDLSNIPDHVFSERFEKKMNKLIRKEAAHPWAVSHTLARNLIAAAIVIILLFTLCMSVGAIRNAIFNFFQQHFDDHDKIIFEMPEKTRIEQEYMIKEIPSGFSLTEEYRNSAELHLVYSNEIGDYISYEQSIISTDGRAIDNERTEYRIIEIDGNNVLSAEDEESITLTWDQDGYVFCLTVVIENVSVEDVIKIYQSICPI